MTEEELARWREALAFAETTLKDANSGKLKSVGGTDDYHERVDTTADFIRHLERVVDSAKAIIALGEGDARA